MVIEVGAIAATLPMIDLSTTSVNVWQEMSCLQEFQFDVSIVSNLRGHCFVLTYSVERMRGFRRHTVRFRLAGSSGIPPVTHLRLISDEIGKLYTNSFASPVKKSKSDICSY